MSVLTYKLKLYIDKIKVLVTIIIHSLIYLMILLSTCYTRGPGGTVNEKKPTLHWSLHCDRGK